MTTEAQPVICDMIGCQEHATGEIQTGNEELIPVCELHRQGMFDSLLPKWRPLPPHSQNIIVDKPS